MKIVVYGAPNCSKCKIFASRLEGKKIPFTKIEDEKEVKEASTKANILSLPIVKIYDKYYTFESATEFLF